MIEKSAVPTYVGVKAPGPGDSPHITFWFRSGSDLVQTIAIKSCIKYI
jgi:hypothetical protein